MNKHYFLFLLALPSLLGFVCNREMIPTTSEPISHLVDYGIPPDSIPTVPPLPDEGAIGDVKYSILSPELFTKANGSGWVLMQGQSLNPGDADELIMQEVSLQRDGGYKLPDARGMFLRGMNEHRDDTISDPKLKKGNPYGNIPVLGEYQADMAIEHDHKVIPQTSDEQDGDPSKARIMINQNFHGNHFDGGGNRDPSYGWYTGLKTDIAGAGNLETRPRHICLYIYVKIKKSTLVQ